MLNLRSTKQETPSSTRHRAARWCGRAMSVIGCLFMVMTCASVRPIVTPFKTILAHSEKVQLTDRNGVPLSMSYQTAWNTADQKPLYKFSEFLRTAYIISEDRNFFDHHGVDWAARVAGLYQNITTRKTQRGSSTITEQVVRMINPRPRNVWSKWIEGIEATLLERAVSKADILEFYLNQVPYAANRRGAVQAARYYFGRDVDTLTAQEILALVVLARAPSSYDLYKNPHTIDAPLERLTQEIVRRGAGDAGSIQNVMPVQFAVTPEQHDVKAQHFVRYVRAHSGGEGRAVRLRTTLDSALQGQVQSIIDRRMADLKARNVHNAAAVVMDHTTGDIVAWVVGGASAYPQTTPAADIDAVTTPRQPGSSMKPFLYARALDKGWTAATQINDAPLAEAIGTGLHRFRNYSNTHYGLITLREALGNSLNIPALLTIRHVGVDDYLDQLHRMGFDSLGRGAGIYDEGLALGNGEVTLLEMVTAYAALANGGVYRHARVVMQDNTLPQSIRVYTPESAAIMGNILSDPWARRLEFGRDSVLNFRQQTAVKTGTSTDYKDAWVFGYNDKYVVGIWMGNLDRTPMNEVTGSVGPALALRSIMTVLGRHREPQKLALSKHLVWRDVCTRAPSEDGKCPMRSELFVAGHVGEQEGDVHPARAPQMELIRPTEGLQIAYDPRIPQAHQKFRFELAGLDKYQKTEWIVDGESLAVTDDGRYLWPVRRGSHTLSVHIRAHDGTNHPFADVNFKVK